MKFPRPACTTGVALLLLGFSFFGIQAQTTVTAVGRELRYNGQRLVLHGVGVADPLLARQDRPASDYTTLAATWQANVVRIAIHPGTWKSVDTNYLVNRLREEISAALANGHFVILTWHVIGWPDGFYEQPGGDLDFYDSDFLLARNYWTRMADEFGNDGRIIFELWNEPVHESDLTPAQQPRWTEMKPYYEQLIAIIRQRSANLVIATGNNFAFDLRGITASPLADTNVAYAWHVYAFGPLDAARLDVALAGLDQIAPVLVTEWGFNFNDTAQWPGDAANFGPSFVNQFLRSRQLHSAAWAWAPGWRPSMLEAGWNTPTIFGNFVASFLAENRQVSARIKGGKTLRTRKKRVLVRGTATAPIGLDRVEIRNGKSLRAATGTATWQTRLRLRKKRTPIRVRAITIDERPSPWQRLVIIRR